MTNGNRHHVDQVKATDRDGSSPNNNLVYRIQAGARDKFVIRCVQSWQYCDKSQNLKSHFSPETGMIAVSRGASLDPDLSQPPTTSYFLEVMEVLTVMVT